MYWVSVRTQIFIIGRQQNNNLFNKLQWVQIEFVSPNRHPVTSRTGTITDPPNDLGLVPSELLERPACLSICMHRQPQAEWRNSQELRRLVGIDGTAGRLASLPELPLGRRCMAHPCVGRGAAFRLGSGRLHHRSAGERSTRIRLQLEHSRHCWWVRCGRHGS